MSPPHAGERDSPALRVGHELPDLPDTGDNGETLLPRLELLSPEVNRAPGQPNKHQGKEQPRQESLSEQWCSLAANSH